MFVNKEADLTITEFLNAVNDGFEAGKATRLEIASFMIQWFKNNAPTDVIDELRKLAANSLSMLDAVHKKAKSGEELPPEVKAALYKYYFGTDAANSKKSKKNLKQESPNGRLIESETL